MTLFSPQTEVEKTLLRLLQTVKSDRDMYRRFYEDHLILHVAEAGHDRFVEVLGDPTEEWAVWCDVHDCHHPALVVPIERIRWGLTAA